MPPAGATKAPKLRLWTPPSRSELVTTVHALKTGLEAGNVPVASLVAANAQTALELQTMAKAHGLQDKLEVAIAILYGEAPKEATKMWLQVQTAGSAPRAVKVPVLPLGNKLPNPPTADVKTVAPPKELANTQVLRVTIPQCFAGQKWKAIRQKPANAVHDLLRHTQLGDNLVSTYGWTSIEKGDDIESVTGYIKVTIDAVPRLLKVSGMKGLFFELLAKDRTNAPVDWVVQGPNEDDAMYLSRVAAMPESFGLAFRRQGKSRLGLRLAPDAKPSDCNQVKLWEARGIPRDWSTGAILSWLRANEWQDVELVAQPTRQRGWLFKAICKSDAICFAYEVGDTTCISVSRFFHANRAPKHKPISSAGRRLGQDSNDIWSKAIGPNGNATSEAMEVEEPPKSVPDKQDSAEITKRASEPGTSPEKKRTKAAATDNQSDKTLHGFQILDFGGDGDCAYRAAAAAYAMSNKRPLDDIRKNVNQLGATLRAQITSHLRRHGIYEESFVPDKRWTTEREAGVVPTTYSEWIEATARPKRWVDGPCLATMATKLWRHIAIFEWRHDKWERVALLSPHADFAKSSLEANNFPPLVLLLKKSHYRVLQPQPSIPFPAEWSIPPTGISFDAGDARGAGKSQAAASQQTPKSLKSWLPASSASSSGTKTVKPRSCKSWLPASSVGIKSKESKRLRSLKSWLPASSSKNFNTKSPAAVSGIDKNAQAVSAWLPASSKACKARSSGATSTAHVPKKLKSTVKDKWFEDTSRTRVLPKLGHKLACDAPPKPVGRRKSSPKASKSSRKGKVKSAAVLKKEQQERRKQQLREKQTSFFTWPCPACDAVFEGMHSSVITSKHHHWRTRHPDLDRSLIMRAPVTVPEVSYVLPPEQQAWTCPTRDFAAPRSQESCC